MPRLAQLDDPTLPTADGEAPAAGARIGRFQVRGTLGAGGTGVVVEAYDPELQRRVAIKLLRAPGRVRLQREAQAMAQLAHPNVVPVYEVGSAGDHMFIAMERVDGRTLRAWLRQPKPWREVVAMFVAAGRGLAAAHAAGLVHRDFKPENVLVGTDGRPRVTDFGQVAGASRAVEPPAGSPVDLSLTIDGSVAGTPAYMSPEHWDAREVDERSDQFSFCVALWEALWGARPFAGDSGATLRAAVLAGTPQRAPARPRVPSAVQRAVRRGLSREGARRWPSMTALLDELERATAPSRLPAIAVTGAVALVAAATAYAAAAGPSAGDACAHAGDGIAATWNERTRNDLRDGLASVDRVYAGDVAARVTAVLDDYAAAWSAMSVSSCEATYVHHQQSAELLDRRTACLDHRRRELAALVAHLADAPDAATLDAASKAALSLDSIDACADPERLLAAVAPPPLERRARADELDAIVAEARARYHTGDYRAGWELLAPVVAEIRALDHAPLTARALYRGAELQSELGELDGAVAALEDALGHAARARDDELAARIGLSLLRTIGYKQRRFGDAARLLPLVHALVARAGDSVEIRAQLLQQRGDLELLESKYEDSRVHLEEARALIHPLGPSPTLVGVLNALGVTYAALARYPDARQTMEQALAVTIEVYGPDHPNVAKTLDNLGLIAQEAGDYAVALDYFERALAAKERTLGVENDGTARSLANVAIALALQGRFADAAPRLEHAIAIFERTLGPDHPEVAQNLANLGEIYGSLGRHEEARALLALALALQTAAYGEGHADLAHVHDNIATNEHNAGNLDAAMAAARRGLGIRRSALGEDHPKTGASWARIGALHGAAGDCRSAIPALAWAHAIVERAQGAQAPPLVQIDSVHALCLVRLRRFRTAEELATRAMAVAEANAIDDQRLAYAQFALASARDAAGTAPRNDNRALAEKALAGFRDAPTARDVQAWLASHPPSR